MSKVKRTEKRGYGKGTRGLCVFPDFTHLVIASCTSEEVSFLLRSCVQALDYCNYMDPGSMVGTLPGGGG